MKWFKLQLKYARCVLFHGKYHTLLWPPHLSGVSHRCNKCEWYI